MENFDYSIVKDPKIYEQNRLSAHSDHEWYKTVRSADAGGMSDYKFLLNGIWYFDYARNYESAVKDFYRRDYDCRRWEKIRVPAHVQMEGYGVPQYANTEYPWDGIEEAEPGQIPEIFNPVASYVRYFTLPEGFEKGRVCISFCGAESGIAVWMNGEYVGYSEDSFTPSDFDLTPFVDRKGENKLAVMVFRYTAGSWCEDQDFFRFSGLFRDVWLYTYPETHIADMTVKTLLSEDLTSARLVLDLKSTGSGTVRVRLGDGIRDLVDEKRELAEDTALVFDVASPDLWSAEKPNLYDLFIEVCSPAGKLSEVVREKVGFRKIEIGRDSVLRINGKRIVFRGVNRHEFSSQSGRAIGRDEILTDILTMKRNNINAVRTSHYPNQTLFYRLCDEYGIYVIDEANLETHGTWDTIRFGMNPEEYAVPGDRSEYKEMVLDRARSMYKRDRNHACVLIWSLGNESYGGRNLFEMHELLHSLDDTRPVHYEGIFWDRRYPKTSDIASSMYLTVDEIKEYLRDHRDKPYISCEYAHAMGNSNGAIKKYTDYVEEEELYQGGFIWDYIDQSLTLRDRYGRTYEGYGGDFGDIPNDGCFSGNGICYGGKKRLPSPKMSEVKFVYQNFGIEVGRKNIIIRNFNLFTDANEYDSIITVEKEGKVVESTGGRLEVPPLTTANLPLPVRVPEEDGEYIVTVSIRTRGANAWADAGHEVAFGQAVFGNRKPRAHVDRPHRNVIGYWNAGIYGDDFSVMFSKLANGMTDYTYGNSRLLAAVPRPNFWRAVTDNDRANVMAARAGQWKIASMYATNKTDNGRDATLCEITQTPDGIKAVFTYHLPTRPAGDCTLSYTVHSDGVTDVELFMDASDQIGQLPEFAVMFAMPVDYENFTWYGKGPDETYADRDHARIGVYEQKVGDIAAKYLVPQESGNKTGVRWAAITDERGRGLMIEGEDLYVSVSDHSPHELECAMHPSELCAPVRTYIRVSLGQMGVAGDDAWGAMPYPEYLLDNSKPLKLNFSIRGI